ncbi:hypothetical protein A6779_15300 [Marinobacter adhaerens]|uniref:Uncharacterized protein n=1 Tax=Marinobacter salsuginis TaxID=418719 RepID=A0A5M3PSA7_9GAMM|nr:MULTISPECIES: DUF5677 domain-containing protein [Marinobacter]ODM28506.1 hypothetical protein A6779_15300 [Marinobacter adhaerens]GBO85671.1 hypothetical protein MS5N3_31220 [Marinobacter salsuginis]
MDEIEKIISRYDEEYVGKSLRSLDDINRFTGTFVRDVAEIYDCITRIRNVDRNPTGFSLEDAPILGLLTRIWKLLKEIVNYYEQDNAEIISILERPLIEAAVTAEYLLMSDSDVIEDYRKCSYKDRLRILRELKEGSRFFETKAGKRLLKSVQEKMDLEGFSEDDFKEQKKNRWKLQGKTFFDIFKEITDEDLYKYTYGMMSESIHGSWNESMDWCLQKNEDSTFTVYPFYHEADARYICPTLKFCNESYRLWLERIDCLDENMINVLDWIERVNNRIFMIFDQKYDGPNG